ncbi:hypothetical protein ACA910_021238 [Epithemia clementina (nom. ined.)]
MFIKRISSISVLLTAAFPFVFAGPISTCMEQWPCLRFTYDPLPTNECLLDQCDYQICMILDYSGLCTKSGTLSHTCEKPDSVCLDGGGFQQGASSVVEGIQEGYTSCQIVRPGGVAEFLVKDGDAAMGCGNMAFNLMGGVPLTCDTLGVQSCTGTGNIGKECVWRLEAPTSCGKSGGGGGDPHFKLWNRDRYMFHGECDLVLVKNDHFANGLGLDLHLRTTINTFYSFIEAAALRIGDDVLVVSFGRFWINEKEGSDDDLPVSFAGFTLQPPYAHGTSKTYALDLNRGDKILFRNYKHFLTVDVSGTAEDFGDSVGLLGNYATGDMLARDGTTIITDPYRFGQEWQVQSDEPMLFLDTREPQHPEATCKMPTVAQSERKLRDAKSAALIKAAETACASKKPEDVAFCTFDVLATEDVGMAGMW